PGINVRAASATSIGKGNYWFQEPNSFNVETKMSKNIGKHYVKVGGEFRQDKVNAARPRTLNLDFGPELTANTYNAPNTGLSGDGWATFLLGALSNNSTAQSIPIQRPKVNFGGVFFQDDFKLSPKITLNLGLRYEYYSPMVDSEYRLSRYLDLTTPIREFQGEGTPNLPSQATFLRTSQPIYTGEWLFTDESTTGSWKAKKTLFMPRIGLAWRVDNNTALRIGWGRYIIPTTLTDGLDILGSVYYPGFDATSTTIAALQG